MVRFSITARQAGEAARLVIFKVLKKISSEDDLFTWSVLFD